MAHRLAKFALVGGIGFIADACAFALCFYLLEIPLIGSRLIAFVVAATVTWFGNRTFTFASQDRALAKQWLKFMSVACISAIPNFLAFKTILLLFGETGVMPMAALVVGVLVGMVSNYLFSSLWVFNKAH
ncbi:hypothetical protein VIOR3934_03297 [Vibrio orientalis CIP 102891 = ATCC 33934]|uniref:GtrA/DPMS transmembrane domain-containing protein n=1 Tax=Vibrio orientalis CIP 102891 = ATCC 33934 TaxID=675816 RepID=C9QJT2_VIBOR|nr:GtrA family protein [Vibrio orientalis]EEX91927.1 hypothetical protein VIA_002571 [Vibrio orientalis CIP 102891 = ATCC 33934]EGU53746.1 hypothetical protein VIOR3934_03297 [Vibrio orientalis CIP 102891 = ATCC 33934]